MKLDIFIKKVMQDLISFNVKFIELDLKVVPSRYGDIDVIDCFVDIHCVQNIKLKIFKD